MQNVVMAHTWHAKPKHETDGKEHSESPNEQQSKYSAANFSAHVNKTCIELPLGTLPCFTRLFESTINITVGSGEATSWQNDKEAAHSL